MAFETHQNHAKLTTSTRGIKPLNLCLCLGSYFLQSHAVLHNNQTSTLGIIYRLRPPRHTIGYRVLLARNKKKKLVLSLK